MSFRSEQIRRDFEKFHQDNPEVWKLFVKFAFQAIKSGRTTYSTSAVVERIRWHTDIETRSTDNFKINNNFRAYYARLFHRTYPEHVGFFRTRRGTSM